MPSRLNGAGPRGDPVWPRYHPPSSSDDVPGDVAELLGSGVLAEIQDPPVGEDPAGARRRLAEALAVKADEDREPLDGCVLISSGGSTAPATTSMPPRACG
jgi:hypothetical protein